MVLAFAVLSLFAVVDAEASSLAARPLDAGHALLDAQEIEAAAPVLEEAARGGPYTRDDAVRLYRDLGLVRAYLDDVAGAERAFAQLLAIDPGHVLPYTTSPRATFLFEKARAAAAATRATALFVDVPAVVEPGQSVSAVVVVERDPQKLARATLRWRRVGEPSFRTLPLAMPTAGARASVALFDDVDAQFSDADDALYVELAVDAFDARGWQLQRGRADDEDDRDRSADAVVGLGLALGRRRNRRRRRHRRRPRDSAAAAVRRRPWTLQRRVGAGSVAMTSSIRAPHALALALALALAFVLASCAGGSLTVDVVLPPGIASGDVSLAASVYAPETEISCEQVAWRDVDDDALAPSLVVSTALDGDSGALGDVPRFGSKLIVVRATSFASLSGEPLVALGCAELGDIADDVDVEVPLERTVVVALQSDSPSQLVTGDADDAGAPLAVLVTDALDDTARDGWPVRLTTPSGVDEQATNDSGSVVKTIAVDAPGPFRVDIRARFEVGPGVDVVGFEVPSAFTFEIAGAGDLEIARHADNGVALVALLETAAVAPKSVVIGVPPAPPATELAMLTSELPAGDLAFVGRALLDADGPPVVLVANDVGSLVAVDASTGDIVETFQPRGTFRFNSEVRTVAVGPCNDADAVDGSDDRAPLIATAGQLVEGGKVEVALVISGRPPSDNTMTGKPVNSFCARRFSTDLSPSRVVIVERREGTVAVDLGPQGINLAVFDPDVDLELPIAENIAFEFGEPDMFGAESGGGSLVVAHNDAGVQVRVDRVIDDALSQRDRNENAAAADSITLPGQALAVGAARLFDVDEPSLFALVSLGGANPNTAAVLVVQGRDGTVAGAPVGICRPANTCTVLAVDVDGDGLEELVLAHTPAREPFGDEEIVVGDAPRAEIWRFAP